MSIHNSCSSVTFVHYEVLVIIDGKITVAWGKRKKVGVVIILIKICFLKY